MIARGMPNKFLNADAQPAQYPDLDVAGSVRDMHYGPLGPASDDIDD